MKVQVSEELEKYCPLTIWQIIVMILRQAMAIASPIAVVVLMMKWKAMANDPTAVYGYKAAVIIWTFLMMTITGICIITRPSIRAEWEKFVNRNWKRYGVVFWETGNGFDVTKPFRLCDISKYTLKQSPCGSSLCIVAPLSSRDKCFVVWGTDDSANNAFRHWLVESYFITTAENRIGKTSFWVSRHDGYGSTLIGVSEAFRFFGRGASCNPYSKRGFERLVDDVYEAELSAREVFLKLHAVVRNIAAAHLVIERSSRFQHSTDAKLARLILEQAIEEASGGALASRVLAELQDNAELIAAVANTKMREKQKTDRRRATETG